MTLFLRKEAYTNWKDKHIFSLNFFLNFFPNLVIPQSLKFKQLFIYIETQRDVLGTDRLPQFNEVVVENRQMLDSFAVVSSELRTLSQNLQNAEDLRERLRIEKLEADRKLQAARIEMAAAEAAKAEAENARRLAEQLAAETLDKAATEAKRLKEQELEAAKIATPVSHSVSAQTDETVVEETITSAVTTKEIHILQQVLFSKFPRARFHSIITQ